jgi:xylulokinase
MASMYATGLNRLGEAGESSGTTSLIFVGCDHATPTNLPLVTKPCPVSDMPYIFDAPITASGASLKWYLDQLGAPEKQYAEKNNINVFSHLNAVAEKVPAGSNGVLYFPYLMGERAPLWNSYAKGMLIGMSMDTTREDILRSVFEGTSYSIRHVIETIREAGGVANSLRITGGGAKSHTWSKIKASVLRMPVYILDERSGDVPFGDTLIAGYAVGVFTHLTDQINKMIRIREVIEPVEEWAKVYDERYPYFLEMYRHLDQDLYRYEKTLKAGQTTL